jgi:hypothetical protein
MTLRKGLDKKFLIIKIVFMTSFFWILLDGIILYNLIDDQLKSKLNILNSNCSLNKHFLNTLKNSNKLLGKKDTDDLDLIDLKLFATKLKQIIYAFTNENKLSSSWYYMRDKISKTNNYNFKSKANISKYFIERYFNKSTNPKKYFFFI